VAVHADPFVGRAAELGSLDDVAARLDRRSFAAVEVAGEPGMGKTRLLAELAERADRRGQLVLTGAASELEADLAKLSQLESERDEYLDTLRRVQAEFENYRKRVIKEQTALVDRATEGLVEQLLPVLDSFELALKNLDSASSEEVESVRKGVELVYAELLGVLEKAGLSRIEAEGKPFDPNVHEAVMQEEGEGEPVVTAVLRTGYTLKGRVLRPAMVKVTRAAR
jgi:molecular chaperone GrpE